MKIGILTQSLFQNYGGLLQNYALQQVLIRAGHAPITIDHPRRDRLTELRYSFGRGRLRFFHAISPKIYKEPAYVPSKSEMRVIAQHTQHFINKYIVKTSSLNTHDAFRSVAESGQFDAYVAGSDQCWRPKYNISFLKEMFLCFAEDQKNVKRIAYAASFGVDFWEMDLTTTTECARLAKKFDLVTVREDSGVALCKNNLGVEAVHVLDPTLLLEKEHYIRIVEEEKEPASSGNLFYYILDPAATKSAFISEVAIKMGLIPFTVLPKYQAEKRTRQAVKKHLEDCVYPSVTSWLRAFMDAKIVIVDSFHGMVFSIIFNKPFVVIGNKGRGMSRFTSLLRLFSLEDRLLDADHLDMRILDRPIDWAHVNKIKEEHMEVSTSLLLNALKDA